MKPYKILDCDCLREIQNQTISFMNKFYQDMWTRPGLWQKIDTPLYLSHNTMLIKWCKGLNFKIREISFTVITKVKDVGVHIDEPPVVAKINVPIQNTANTFNRWFNIPDGILNDPKYIKTNKFGAKYKNFDGVDINDLTQVAEYELTKPIIFNSAMAHSVNMGKDCKVPRMVMSLMLFDDIKNLLEE